MKDRDLLNKRVIPCLNELYSEAENLLGLPPGITYEELKDLCLTDDQGRQLIEVDWFYLDEERFRKIRSKYTKGLRHHWRWPYRSEIIYSDDEVERMKKAMETMDKSSVEYRMFKDKVVFNDVHKERERLWEEYLDKSSTLHAELESGKLTKKEYKKQKDTLCKSYGMSWRSNDKERVEFTIFNYGPSCSKRQFERRKKSIEMIDRLVEGGMSEDDAIEEVFVNMEAQPWGASVKEDVVGALALRKSIMEKRKKNE